MPDFKRLLSWVGFFVLSKQQKLPTYYKVQRKKHVELSKEDYLVDSIGVKPDVSS